MKRYFGRTKVVEIHPLNIAVHQLSTATVPPDRYRNIFHLIDVAMEEPAGMHKHHGLQKLVDQKE
jgi:hypothetical protein